MRNCWIIMLAGALLALSATVRAAAPQPFVVVRIAGLDKTETNQVMAAADFQALQADIRAEAPLFTRALQAAADEWKKDEELRKKPFPATAFACRQAAVVGPPYDTEQKAGAALKVLLPRVTRMDSSKRKSKTADAKDERMAEALEMLTDHLVALKGGPGQPSADAVAKIELKPGQTLSRKTEGPLQTGYHIGVPDTYDPAKPPPLLLLFSPGGDGRGLMNQVRASANRVGWMVIGCDRLKNGMSDEDAAPITKELFADFHKFIPYDTDRLYFGGFSGGAARAYHLTWKHKDRCAGILAFGGWLGLGEDLEKPFQKKMTVAMVNGDTDKGALSYEDRDKGILSHRRSNVKIFHFPGGHGVAPRETIDKAVQWMDEQAAPKESAARTPSPGKR